jgi:hypothetical protein
MQQIIAECPLAALSARKHGLHRNKGFAHLRGLH